jgi:hypothetical protein
MKISFDWWPFMLRSNHEAIRRENFNLRGALGQANAELRKHRLLLGSLKQGNAQATEAVMRAMSKTAADQ